MPPSHRVSIFNAARLLGVSRTRVYQFIEAGRLSVTREGRRLWLNRGQVEALHASRWSEYEVQKQIDRYLKGKPS